MKKLILLLFLSSMSNLYSFDYGKFSFFFTNDFLYQNNNLATDENQFYNSFSMVAKVGKWSGGLTFRGFNFYKQSSNFTLDENQFDLYRKYVQYSSKDLNVKLGDFYSMLGRGLVLSVLQNEEAFREKTIFGGDLRYKRDFIRFRVLGGTVEHEREIQKWRVGGAECDVEYWKNNRVGVHMSYIESTRSFLNLGARWTYSFSVAGDNLFDMLSYYAEVSRLDFKEKSRTDGSAVYANVGYSRKNVSVLMEYKKYNYFDNELNNPPGADRNDELTNIIDSEGGRLYAQYSFFDPDLVLFVSLGRLREFFFTGNHIYGGFTVEDLWEKVDAGFTYGVKDLSYPIKRIDGDFLYRFSDSWSVELSVKDKRYEEYSFKFNEKDFLTELSWSPYGSVFFQYQYSEFLINNRNHFYSGGLKFYIKQDSYVEISGGSLRGGEVCSGGQCFYRPPFEGWKLSAYFTIR